DDRDAPIVDDVQGVDTKDDLVKGTGRDEPDQEGVEGFEVDAGRPDSAARRARRSVPGGSGTAGGAGGDASGQSRRGAGDRRAPHPLQRPGERLHVPAIPRGEDSDARPRAHGSRPNDWRSIFSTIAPAEKTRPVAAFTTVTCAGLNSIGSMA